MSVDSREPAVDMVRRRSVVWDFFKTIDPESVQCVLCTGYLVRNDQGSTTNMLRHLRVKHPTEVKKLKKGRVPESTSITITGKQEVETDNEQFCSVEVALDEEDSDALTTANDIDFDSAINGILEAAQKGPAERITHEEASDGHTVRRGRNKPSLIWRHFERLDSLAAACCRICTKKIQCFEGRSTSNLRRHMSKRHPVLFSQLVAEGQNPPPSQSSQGSRVNGDTAASAETVGATEEQPLSVEVTLDDGDSDALTTANDIDFNSAINGILEVAQKGPAGQTTHEVASDGRPVRRGRNKQSLIWRHFERLDGLAAARCHICTKKIQCSEGSSTSNLRRHMSKRHPGLFSQLVADGQNPPPSQSSHVNGHTSESAETVVASEEKLLSGALKVSRSFEGEKRVLRRERELIEALRRTQREEARALEHQRELVERLRALGAREAATEREQIESLRKAQLEEAEDLSRQREELQREKAELQKKWEQLQQEREELLLFNGGKQAS